MASSTAGFSSKPSFAKVAAMAAPQQPRPMSNNAKYSHNNEGSQVATAPVQPVVVHPATSISIEEITAKTPKSLHIESGLERTIEKLELRERADEAIDSQATPAPDLPKASSSSEDEQSHVSGSSSKLQSFDTKSIASITTFQMDEKESLRPDDSASVQAIDEDESIVNSRVGSELGPVGPRDVSRDLLLKRAPVVLPGNGLRFGELSPATPNSMAQNPALRQMSFISGERLHTAESQATPAIPDEKLLEAMATPKDRLLLLQMEEKVLIFIHDNKDEYLDLPPQNSFGRMLAHKLADYYNLNHFVGNDASTVRLFRTPASRLPPLLSSFASAISQNASNPAMAGVKIMRRGGASSRKASVNPETPTSSSAPSKATSEAGGDTNSEEGLASPAEPNTNKEKAKLTREEREAQYEAARRRIFADIPESTDMPNGGESSASMSRSSSASGKKRGHKQRQPKDDSFEARSQFNMYYPGMHFANNNAYTGRQPNIGYGQAPFVSQGQSNTAGSGFASPAVPFQPYGQQPYAQMQQFPIDQSHYGQQMGWSGMQNDATSPFYSFDASSPMSNTQPSDVQSPAMNQYAQPLSQYQTPGNSWMQQSLQQPYPQNPMPGTSPPMVWPNYSSQSSNTAIANPSNPFQYGQFPQSFGPVSPHHQHQMPGQFSRPAFNPQTRSFVPNSMSSRFPVHNHYPGSLQPPTKPSQASSYTAADQGHLNHQISRPIGPLRNQSQFQSLMPNDQESIQKKWGTPSHLPKKPPPSEVPSAFDIDSTLSLPSQQQSFGAQNNGFSKNNGAPMNVQGGNGSSQNYSTTAKVLAGGN